MVCGFIGEGLARDVQEAEGAEPWIFPDGRRRLREWPQSVSAVGQSC